MLNICVLLKIGFLHLKKFSMEIKIYLELPPDLSGGQYQIFIKTKYFKTTNHQKAKQNLYLLDALNLW